MLFMKVLAVLGVAIPISFVATFTLFPLWSWCEEALAIESVGHSAPAGWCFAVTYAVIVTPILVWLLRRAWGAGAADS